MQFFTRSIVLLSLFLVFATVGCSDEPPATAQVMESVKESDWRKPDPANLLYMELSSGTVIMELAPGFAPENVANIKTLTREKYYDGLAIIRSQDNYVVQWADPAEEEDEAKSIGTAAETVVPEFQRSSNDVKITTIESRDAYAAIRFGFGGFFGISILQVVYLPHAQRKTAAPAKWDADDATDASIEFTFCLDIYPHHLFCAKVTNFSCRAG